MVWIRPSLECRHLLGLLDFFFAPDVADGDTSTVQGPRDEKEAMALGRVLLAAHDGHPELLRPFHEPRQTGFEARSLGYPAIQNMIVRVVELIPIRLSTEFLPEKEVPDTRLVEPEPKRLKVVLWVESGKRRSAHVGHHLDPVSPEKAHELVDRMGRVTDGHNPRTVISLIHNACCAVLAHISMFIPSSRRLGGGRSGISDPDGPELDVEVRHREIGNVRCGQ